jgi:uncharacterized protein (DUF1919 family)
MSLLPYRVKGPAAKAWYAGARELGQRTSELYRSRLERDDFSVVCANCWGSEIYRHVGIPYRTPFVGMIIEAPCYLRMLRDLPAYLSAPFEWTGDSKYPHIKARMDGGTLERYPIGVLRGDVEVHFIHYATAAEAEEKWVKRAQRVNWDNLLVSLVEYGAAEAQAAPEYDALPYERKLLITPDERPEIRSAWRVRGDYTNAVSLYYHGLSQLDVIAWVNDGTLQRPPSIVHQWWASRPAA